MKDETEDFKEWGDAWVYCNQHLRPHKTGWCTVGLRNKVCVCAGNRDESEAFQKCRDIGLKLYSPNK